MNLITPQNIPRNYKSSNILLRKHCECESFWFVPINQILGIVDLAWEVVHYVSEHFSEGVVRIACLSRNLYVRYSSKLWCLWLCDNSCLDGINKYWCDNLQILSGWTSNFPVSANLLIMVRISLVNIDPSHRWTTLCDEIHGIKPNYSPCFHKTASLITCIQLKIPHHNSWKHRHNAWQHLQTFYTFTCFALSFLFIESM